MMQNNSRAFAMGVIVGVGVAACQPAFAAWPDDKPTEVIVGFAPGGETDVMARKLLPYVEKRIGGNAKFVVVNRPGAGGEIATTAIARAPADGFMIGLVNVPGYNFLPLTRPTQYNMDQLRLVARVVDDPGVIVVRNDSKFKKLSDLIDALRSQPKVVTCGHNGAGTNGDLALRMLAKAEKLQINEISYKGSSAQRTDLLGGHLEVGVMSVGGVPELHGDTKGELRVLAVLSDKRSAALPNVPTAKEAGVSVMMSSERGFAVTKAMPDEIVKKLEAAIEESIRDPEFVKGSPGDATVLAFMKGADWQAHIDSVTKDLKPLAEEIKAEQK